MMAQMTWKQFRAWRAYYSIEPFGEWRADYRMGVLAAVTVNIHSKKGSRVRKATDFIPEFGIKPGGAMTSVTAWNQMKARARAYAEGR